MTPPAYRLETQDCLTWLSRQKAGTFQLFVLDPPYNVGYRYGRYKDQKPRHLYLNEQLLVLSHCEQLLKPGGSVFYLNYPENASEIWGKVDFLDKVEIRTWVYHPHLGGFPFRKGSRTWLWLSRGKPLFRREAFKGEYRNPEDPRIKARIAQGKKPMGMDWFEMSPVKNTSRQKRNHPCQLPEKIVEEIILGTTNLGDLVGDCYAGSGTTGICAVRHGRNFAGCELDKAYSDEALRIIQAEKDKAFTPVGA